MRSLLRAKTEGCKYLSGLKTGNTKIEVIDNNGRIVYVSEDCINNGETKLKLPSLAYGVYILKVKQNNSEKNKEIIVK